MESNFDLPFIHSQQSKHFKEILHLCFQVGHMYMEADHDFTVTEKQECKTNYIFNPDDHESLIKNAKKSTDEHFVVTQMQQ